MELTHDTDIAFLLQPADQTLKTLLRQLFPQTLGLGVAVRKIVGRVGGLLPAAFRLGARLGATQLPDIENVHVEFEPL